MNNTINDQCIRITLPVHCSPQRTAKFGSQSLALIGAYSWLACEMKQSHCTSSIMLCCPSCLISEIVRVKYAHGNTQLRLIRRGGLGRALTSALDIVLMNLVQMVQCFYENYCTVFITQRQSVCLCVTQLMQIVVNNGRHHSLYLACLKYEGSYGQGDMM